MFIAYFLMKYIKKFLTYMNNCDIITADGRKEENFYYNFCGYFIVLMVSNFALHNSWLIEKVRRLVGFCFAFF